MTTKTPPDLPPPPPPRDEEEMENLQHPDYTNPLFSDYPTPTPSPSPYSTSPNSIPCTLASTPLPFSTPSRDDDPDSSVLQSFFRLFHTIIFFITTILFSLLSLICLSLVIIVVMSVISSSVFYFLLEYPQQTNPKIFLQSLAVVFGSILFLDIAFMFVSVFCSFLAVSWEKALHEFSERRKSKSKSSGLDSAPVYYSTAVNHDLHDKFSHKWEKYKFLIVNDTGNHPMKVLIDEFKKIFAEQHDTLSKWLSLTFILLWTFIILLVVFWGADKTIITLVIMNLVIATIYIFANCVLNLVILLNTFNYDRGCNLQHLLTRQDFTFSSILHVTYVIIFLFVNVTVLIDSKVIFGLIIIFILTWYLTQAICYHFGIFFPFSNLYLPMDFTIGNVAVIYVMCRMVIYIIFLIIFLTFSPFLGALSSIFYLISFLGFGNKPGKPQWIIPVILVILLGLIGLSLGFLLVEAPLTGTPISINPVLPSNNSTYDGCQTTWHGMNLLDLSLLSKMSYMEDSTFNQSLSVWFGGTLQHMNYNTTSECNPSKVDRAAYFFPLMTSNQSVSVIIVRGTATVADWVQAVLLWQETVFFQLLMPSSVLLSDTFATNVIWVVSLLEDLFNSRDFQYYTPVEKCVNELVSSGKKVLLTGHSLGGGVSKIVAIKSNQQAVTFSSPGVSFSRKKFGLDDQKVQSGSVTVQPMQDVIPLIDRQAGQVQWIKCDSGTVSCHPIDTTVCELRRSCGDPKGRNFIRNGQPTC